MITSSSQMIVSPSSKLRRFVIPFLLLTSLQIMTACAKKEGDPDLSLQDGGLGGRGGVATPGSTQDFMVNIGDKVYFETDSSDISDSARSTLDKQAAWLNRYPRYPINIEGHADERGTREYNFALGSRRAEAVKNYLTARGIGGNRLRTVSFGKERLAVACGDESCSTQNRRAVLNISGN